MLRRCLAGHYAARLTPAGAEVLSAWRSCAEGAASWAAKLRLLMNTGSKERTVIVEYPSLERATASYGSPAYQEALKALGEGVVRDVRIVEGVE